MASVRALLVKPGVDASKVTAQDVVDLAYGAANTELGGHDKGLAGRGRVRSVGPVEQGAGRLSGPEDVLQYYAGGQSAGTDSAILGTDQPGTEIVQRGEPYGPYKDVVTVAFIGAKIVAGIVDTVVKHERKTWPGSSYSPESHLPEVCTPDHAR